MLNRLLYTKLNILESFKPDHCLRTLGPQSFTIQSIFYASWYRSNDKKILFTYKIINILQQFHLPRSRSYLLYRQIKWTLHLENIH